MSERVSLIQHLLILLLVEELMVRFDLTQLFSYQARNSLLIVLTVAQLGALAVRLVWNKFRGMIADIITILHVITLLGWCIG